MKNEFTHSKLILYQPLRDLPIAVTNPPRGAHKGHEIHDHNFTEITLVEEGCAMHSDGIRSALIQPGDVVVIPPGIPHHYRGPTDDFVVLNLLCAPEQMFCDGVVQELRQFFNSSDRYDPAPVFHLDEDDMKRYLNLVSRIRDALLTPMPGARMGIMSAFCEVLTLLRDRTLHGERKGRSDFRLGAVILYINDHYQRDIDIEALCSLANMSRRNFFRVFSRTFGITPNQYINDLRLKRAAQLLLTEKIPIYEIAYRCGFCDCNYLCKQFRHRYGKTPSQYRRIGSH